MAGFIQHCLVIIWHCLLCGLLEWWQWTLTEEKIVYFSYVQLLHLCLRQANTSGQKSARTMQFP